MLSFYNKQGFINSITHGIVMVFIFLPVFTIQVSAQQYKLLPNDSMIGIASDGEFKHFTIFQKNLSELKLVFSWKKLELTIPSGWIANLCDNGHCYTDFPDSGTMDTVFAGDVGLMSIGIDPGEYSGNAYVRYVLWEEHSPEHHDTLTWNISPETTTLTSPFSNFKVLDFYPNPATNDIHYTTSSPVYYVITDIEGKNICMGALDAGSGTIPVQHLSNGIYCIQSSVANQNKFLISKFIIQH